MSEGLHAPPRDTCVRGSVSCCGSNPDPIPTYCFFPVYLIICVSPVQGRSAHECESDRAGARWAGGGIVLEFSCRGASPGLLVLLVPLPASIWIRGPWCAPPPFQCFSAPVYSAAQPAAAAAEPARDWRIAPSGRLQEEQGRTGGEKWKENYKEDTGGRGHVPRRIVGE